MRRPSAEQHVARPDLPVPEGAEELVRALRSPATPAELACEPRAVAAFRNAYREGGPATARKRRRLTLTAALATGAVASLSITGVAAAYTGALPRPLQRAMHAVLGPVGIPAPVAAARRTVPVGPVTPAVPLPEAAPEPEPATVTPPASAASPVAAALTPDQRARALCRLVARRPSDPALRGRLARLTHAGEDVAALCRRVDPAPARTPHAPPSPSPSRSPSPSPTGSSPAPLPTPSAPGPTATAGAGPAPTARPTRSP